MENDKNIREIKDGEKVLAIVYSKKLKAEGARFLTPESYPLQVGLLEHKDGKDVPLHRHPLFAYNVTNTQELLYIERGSAEIVVTDDDWKEIGKTKLGKGDFILFVAGGHKVDIGKGSRIIEVKQGPYPGDKVAKIFKDKN